MIHPLGRILFQGLWCMADREGRLEDRPLRIKVEVLPYDKCDIDKLLGTLAPVFITRYMVNGNNYIQINNFNKHQWPHKKEIPSTIPPNPNENGSRTEVEQKSPGLILNTDSLILDTSKDIPPPKISEKKIKKQKTPLPENFTISPAVKEWAAKKGHDRLDEHLEAFKRKVAMKGYEYIDWDSAFMEAVREDWAKLRYIKGSPAPVEYIPKCQTPAPKPPQPDPFCLKCGGKGEYPGEKEILNRIIKVRVRCTCLDQEEPG